MIRAYGIDTSVLVRLVTGEPEPDFRHCVNELRILIEGQDAEMFASNQVIGEAYVVLQHHYGISAADACAGLVDVLTSDMVAPRDEQMARLPNVRRLGTGTRMGEDDRKAGDSEPARRQSDFTGMAPAVCTHFAGADTGAGRCTHSHALCNRVR